MLRKIVSFRFTHLVHTSTSNNGVLVNRVRPCGQCTAEGPRRFRNTVRVERTHFKQPPNRHGISVRRRPRLKSRIAFSLSLQRCHLTVSQSSYSGRLFWGGIQSESLRYLYELSLLDKTVNNCLIAN